MLGQHMTGIGFGSYGNHEYGLGGLEALFDVTRKKFGQPGLDALVRYPHLTTALIDNTLYLKEEGTARPASTFSLHKLSDDTLVRSGVTGHDVVMGSGCSGNYDPQTGFPCGVMYQPAKGGSSNLPLIVGAIVAVVVIGAVIVMS